MLGANVGLNVVSWFGAEFVFSLWSGVDVGFGI